MKVLLCTPYKDNPDIVRGGINQWGQNILSYFKTHNEEVEIIPVSFDRHVSRIYYDTIFQRLNNGIREHYGPIKTALKIIKKEAPDVIHICTSAGTGSIGAYILLKYAKRHNVKSVIHLHFGRLPELATKRNWEWKMLKLLLDLCDIIVPMNRPSEYSLYNLGYTNVKYLPNPLNIDFINSLIQDNTIERRSRQILYVGHVYKSKGVVELVKGCKNIEGVRLRIVGKCIGDIKNELINVGTKEGAADWIEFVGEISHTEVIEEFLKADLFVFPSYTEGFPNVILEAMACGCPIISSSVGAIPEMLDIEGTPCGLCIQPHSSKEVHEAVVSLINDQEKKNMYSERAKLRVNSLYTLPVVCEQLLEIWKTSLS